MATDILDQALTLRRGLLAWRDADPHVDGCAMMKAMRDNWDRRIGLLKFGGVWSVAMARRNERHPASCAALALGRTNWTGKVVTVERAVPIRVLFEAFIAANTEERMRDVIDSYHVAVVTRSENAALVRTGLALAMPCDWVWGGDPLARWRAVGIEVGSTRAP